MNPEEAKQFVTKVEAGTDKKKQLGDYEPAKGHSAFHAVIPHETDEEGNDLGPVEDPEEVWEALNELSWQCTEESIMERWEQHVRKDE